MNSLRPTALLIQLLAAGCAGMGDVQPRERGANGQRFEVTGSRGQGCPRSVLLTPDAPEMNRIAPEVFQVRLETSKGRMVVEVHRDWAPHGADRFYNLVRAGFYDEARFFRVIAGRWAQFGVNGEPGVARVWRTRTIPDDPQRESNVRGTIAYAFAVPNGRTTQVFINLRDNSATHDAGGFVPFGRVIEGMEVADALNAEYGESAGGGIRAGKQDQLFEQGNECLKRQYPQLDYIKRAVLAERGVKQTRDQTLRKGTKPDPRHSLLLTSPEINRIAPELFQVLLETK